MTRICWSSVDSKIISCLQCVWTFNTSRKGSRNSEEGVWQTKETVDERGSRQSKSLYGDSRLKRVNSQGCPTSRELPQMEKLLESDRTQPDTRVSNPYKIPRNRYPRRKMILNQGRDSEGTGSNRAQVVYGFFCQVFTCDYVTSMTKVHFHIKFLQ